jgi:hypothetical protein
MSTRTRLAAALLTASTGWAVIGDTAQAAPPANDTFAGRTPVVYGFSETIDTTEATTDADDAELNTFCGAPATDASVWYTFTAPADGGLVIDVSASDYSAGVLVGVGEPGTLELVTCGPGTVGLGVVAGVTYQILAIDDQLDGAGNGGMLTISFNPVPPPPTVELTVDPTGRVNNKTGTALISGTYTCTDADFLEVFGDTRQQVGRFLIIGFFSFFDEGTCDGTPQRWTAEVFSDNGKFSGGKSMTIAFAFGCGPFQCAESFVEQTVHLRGGGK